MWTLLLGCGSTAPVVEVVPAPPAKVAPVVPATPLPAGLAPEVTNQGACPFECCNYNDHWVTSQAVPLFDAMDGKPIGTIAANTTFTGITGTVKVRPGVARVTRAHPLETKDGVPITAEPGKMVYPLDALGEGFANVWYEGKTYETEAWFIGDDCKGGGDGCWAEPVTQPQQRWWAKVKTPGGQEGWIDMDKAATIAGVDGCG